MTAPEHALLLGSDEHKSVCIFRFYKLGHLEQVVHMFADQVTFSGLRNRVSIINRAYTESQ